MKNRIQSLSVFGFSVEIEDDLGAAGTREFTLTIVEYSGMKGNPTLEGEISILDALMTINMILDHISPASEKTWAADCNGAVGRCNGDDTVDILDVIQL